MVSREVVQPWAELIRLCLAGDSLLAVGGFPLEELGHRPF